MENNPVEKYLAEVNSAYVTGKSREHTHRPALKDLVRSIDPKLGVLNEPERSQHGAPDFVFLRGPHGDLTAGYGETKDIGADLNKVEQSEQLKRYFGYHNLILTDYLEFRFFLNGEKYCEPIRVAKLENGRIIPVPERFTELETALRDFFTLPPEQITSGARLAKIMGGKASRIRDNVAYFVRDDTEERGSNIRAIYILLKRLLDSNLTKEKFADMYAQTLVYGLFVARYHDETPDSFNRQEARDLVPPSNPFLCHFFDHIAGPEFEKRLAHIVNELCEVFRVANVRALMNDYYRGESLWGESVDAPDPVIHFYEDFLKEYDPTQRVQFGVFYTPLPVVRFIIRSVDELLRRDFGIVKGLADDVKIEHAVERHGKKFKRLLHRVQILDPAVGTGTFLNETINLIRKSFDGQEGTWKSYVISSLLPRLYGFELMMASYTIAHLKLAMTLRDTGFKDFEEHVGLYLTNSLSDAPTPDGDLFEVMDLRGTITLEAQMANEVKRDRPIMVVIGNPPYSGESQNPHYTGNDVYKVEHGGKEKLKERNSKWINDDYVKFIRLAESMIEKNEEGVIGMITAHGWLDNPTFRGMRWHLRETFDELYVLDLHGNANKQEVGPDGKQDKNVFDIKQGVAILLAVKKGRDKKKKKSPAKVFRADLTGDRATKFDYLNTHDVASVKWKEVIPVLPNIPFVAEDTEKAGGYREGFSVAELFMTSAVGIITARDGFVIGTDEQKLLQNAEKFSSSQARTQAELCSEVGISNKVGWDGLRGRELLRREASLNEFVKTISYRLFDSQKIFYHPSLIWRPVEKIMKHLVHENVALVSCRQTIGDTWQHVFLVNTIVDDSYLSNRSRERGYVFPLYLFADDGSRVSNLKKEIVAEIEKIIGKTTPEDIFDYIYAVLHSPNYREKYKEFLKIDFPRVPYPKDKKQFTALVALGKELRGLHLLESPKVKQFITSYPEDGSNVVEKITRKDDKVYINTEQYFGEVPEVAWNFYIGGYQPAQKWLKDKKGRTLSSDDLVHYQKIIVALTETARMMKEIDKVL